MSHQVFDAVIGARDATLAEIERAFEDGRALHGWETHDARQVVPSVAVTIEPGIYLPNRFGVRSEIDMYITENGPRVTTEVQRSVVLIQE